ncbi:MAG: sulfotransferase family 2 domain-containing protein [Christensenellales bacterium]|jgi:chondroitin 4-sulfotransferase 11
MIRGYLKQLDARSGIRMRRIIAFLTLLRRVHKRGSYYSRSIFCVPEKKLLYLSVSKAGNTSIKAALYALPETDDYRTIHADVRKIGENRRATEIVNYPDYDSFTFVRNPLERLVSCYENKFHSDKASVGRTIRTLIYDRYLLGFLAKDRGFRNFARRVCLIPDRNADRHFASQSMNALDADGKIIVDYVGKFENFADDFETLRRRFDLAPLPHYNKTKKSGRNWMDYYDLKTAKRVYQRYRTDIAVFGYQDAYDALIDYLKAKEHPPHDD